MPDTTWLIERRIACEGYPASEARYASIEDYVETLEKIAANLQKRNTEMSWTINPEGMGR